MSARRVPVDPCAVALLAAALSGCQNQQSIVVPNRVLDRPLDVVLACVQWSGTAVEVLSLNQCKDEDAGSCNVVGTTPQLIGFVANSERNELAMFRRCDREAALVDLDPQSPGYNLIPAGILPSALSITEDSCRVVGANAGSCDFTLVDVPGMAIYALDTDLSSSQDASHAPDEPPSGLLSTLVPRTSEGVPLASSPAAIVTVPSSLSLAGPIDDEGEGGVVGDTDAAPEGTICSGIRPASVYVAFPSCQLVAEISLSTSTVLQSRQLVTTETGEVEIVDSGSTPICPVDCPAQLEGGAPDAFELVDPNGVFPSTLALVMTPSPDLADDPAESAVTHPSLFVGGPGSDFVFEIPIEDDGTFAPVANTLRLDDPQGVQKIRVTPPFLPPEDAVPGEANEPRQFVYVIAGDGSTHVVDRDFDPGVLGIECDTQIDPTLEPPTFCSPITVGQNVNAIARRPFAVGPGIRAPLGATINDWVFHKLTAADLGAEEGQDVDQSDCNPRTPFCVPGMVGVGVTSLGTVVYSSFGQYSASDTVAAGIDPVGVMQIQVRPHSLWPAIDPFAINPPPEALPLVSDEEPGRAIPGGGVDAQTLSPSLRRIDLAYSAEGNVTAAQEAIASALGGVTNVDQLGSREGEGLYEDPVVRAAVRDFQQWGTQTWTFEWEPTVPGTTSSTGLLECDNHGSVDGSGNEIPGGTCRNVEPDTSRLRDESANFCEDGVLAGDKLALLGCLDDDSCGLGQRCLRDPTSPTTASGICVSAQAYEDPAEREALRDACAPFIRDACGSAQREYRITRATNDELWLQPLERRRRSVVRDMAGEDEPVTLREYTARFTCDAPVRHVVAQTCVDDADCLADPYDPDNQRGDFFCDKSGLPPQQQASGEGRCMGQQPDGGCADDEDCLGLGAQYLCVDSTCRAPCDLCAPPAQPPQPCDTTVIDGSGEEQRQACLGEDEVCIAGICHQPCDDGNPGCLLSPLPGPRCFPELNRYSIRLNESFSFTGSSTSFLTDRVITDPNTGECVEDPEVSSLLTSRIRLGADAASTFGTGTWQIADCVNPEEAQPSDPNPCRIATDRLTEPDSLFHGFRYANEPIAAIRFSNPVMSVTIDLVSLLGITADPPEYAGEAWPAQFAEFLRARIPSGYREEFSTTNGFIPYNEPVVVGARTPMVYPVTIIAAPEARADFIVDAGGRGGVAGIRGQVIRITHGTGQVLADGQFLVR